MTFLPCPCRGGPEVCHAPAAQRWECRCARLSRCWCFSWRRPAPTRTPASSRPGAGRQHRRAAVRELHHDLPGRPGGRRRRRRPVGRDGRRGLGHGQRPGRKPRFEPRRRLLARRILRPHVRRRGRRRRRPTDLHHGLQLRILGRRCGRAQRALGRCVRPVGPCRRRRVRQRPGVGVHRVRRVRSHLRLGA
jgi:hypothetical protein